jgi:hypothetical protein
MGWEMLRGMRCSGIVLGDEVRDFERVSMGAGRKLYRS